MNSLADEISKSSGNINTLVHRLTAQHEGELKNREIETKNEYDKEKKEVIKQID